MNAGERVLCTGAGGFIGRHLVRYLAAKGYEVCGLLGPMDEPVRGGDEGISYVRGDLTDPQSLSVLRGPYAYVYHLAGILSCSDQMRFLRVNRGGTMNLCRALLNQGAIPRRLLFTSSIAAVGPSSWSRQHREESPCCPVSAYGRSKLEAEAYLQSPDCPMPVTIVRLPLVYGPGNTGGFYPYFKMISRRICVGFGDAESTVGFVDDIVRGLVLAAENPRAAGEIYFLGEEHPYRFDEIMSDIEDALGRKALRVRFPYWLGYLAAAVVEYGARSMGAEPGALREDLRGYLKHRSWLADVHKAQRDLGYRTEVPFDVGVQRTVAWYREKGLI